MINVGIVGYGYWGPNLVRNFIENQSTSVRCVCDLDGSRLKRLQVSNPHIKTTTSYQDVLNDDAIQLIVISTPVSSHYKLAKSAILAGKNVLIEKPMTATVPEAISLIDLAQKQGVQIFVDHTYIFTGAVKKIKELIVAGEVGDIYYFDSVRINLGLFQHDVNVIWDLAPHDLSIMEYLIDEKPVSISAIGANRIHDKHEDIAHVSVKFKNGLMAHFHVNWMSPVKIRRIILGGNKKMIVFDDLDADDKVKVYDKGIQMMKASKDKIYKNLVQYRIGDMHSPIVDRTEALKSEVAHIIDCLKHNKKPLVDGEAGLKVVTLLENAQKSLENDGTFIKL